MTTNPTIAGCLLEYWVLQLEVLHDTAGTQVKVLLHNLVQLLQEEEYDKLQYRGNITVDLPRWT